MTFVAKGQYISDIVEKNQRVKGIFVTSDVHRGTDKNGNPYWSLDLNDISGSIQAKIWAQNGELRPADLESRTFVEVSGLANMFRDAMQLRVDSLRVLSPEERAGLDLSQYVPPSPYNGPAMMEELMQLVHREVDGTPWQRLVDVYFGDRDRYAAFVNASAARTMHHVGMGGLACHTLEVCKICLSMADQFPYLDRPALVVGALFHDIGKLEEMATDPFEVSYTTPGNLIGHMVLGVAMLQGCCEKAELPAPLREHLFHMILSHHGQIEFGAVKEPATREAQVLASADYLDAKLNTMTMRLANVEEGQFSQTRDFGRSIYSPVTTQGLAQKGEPQPAAEAVPAAEAAPCTPSAGDAAGQSGPAGTFCNESPCPSVARTTLQSAMGTVSPVDGCQYRAAPVMPAAGPDSGAMPDFMEDAGYLASLQADGFAQAPLPEEPAAPRSGRRAATARRSAARPQAAAARHGADAGASSGHAEEDSQLSPGSLGSLLEL